MDNENNNIKTYDDTSTTAVENSNIYYNGSQIQSIYLGESNVTAIYKGDTLIYSV